VGKEYKMVHM